MIAHLHLNKSDAVNKPYLLGLGYEFQKMTVVPNDSWDVLLDGVLTEKEWVK